MVASDELEWMNIKVADGKDLDILAGLDVLNEKEVKEFIKKHNELLIVKNNKKDEKDE